MGFCERLKEYMRNNDLTQRALSEIIGCAPGTLSGYISGKNAPNIVDFLHYAKRMGVTGEWLLGEDGGDLSPKYIGEYDADGLLNKVSQIKMVIGDVYVLEAINYFDMGSIISMGAIPDDDIVIDQVYEKKWADLENPKVFYSWLGIAGEFVRDEKERDRIYKEKKDVKT